MINQFVVILEKSYRDNFNACAYTIEENARHKGNYILTPINIFALYFPCIVLNNKEINRTNIRKFNFPNEMYKAIGFANFTNNFISYIDLCKKNPYKFYIKYNKSKIYFNNKRDIFYINNEPVFEAELYNMIFKTAWEYDNVKFCKYNIIKRIFKIF